MTKHSIHATLEPKANVQHFSIITILELFSSDSKVNNTNTIYSVAVLTFKSLNLSISCLKNTCREESTAYFFSPKHSTLPPPPPHTKSGHFKRHAIKNFVALYCFTFFTYFHKYNTLGRKMYLLKSIFIRIEKSLHTFHYNGW